MCAALFLLAGYAGAVDYLKTYTGKPLPREGAAFLVREYDGIRFYSIDEKIIPGACESVPTEHLRYLELLPGKHTVKIRDVGTTFSLGGWLAVDFEALAGHTYAIDPQIVFDNNTQKGTWNPSAVDITGQLETAKKDLSKSIDEAFTKYRQNPARPLLLGDNIVLLNSYYLNIAFDDEEKFHDLNIKYFKLTPGKHTLKVKSAVRRNDPADLITFTAEAKHLYKLIAYEGNFYKIKVIDVTNEMDNVNEPLVDSINDFLKK